MNTSSWTELAAGDSFTAGFETADAKVIETEGGVDASAGAAYAKGSITVRMAYVPDTNFVSHNDTTLIPGQSAASFQWNWQYYDSSLTTPDLRLMLMFPG